jgi:hypothetical protein
LNKCIIQIKNFFNIEKERNLERSYEKYWFFFLIISLTIILTGLSAFVVVYFI